MKNKKIRILSFLVFGLLLTGSYVSITHASTQTRGKSVMSQNTENKNENKQKQTGLQNKGTLGTVTAISGNTITITVKNTPQKDSTSETSTETTYTVDASGATFMKNGATANISNVVVGDKISVEGTTSGTTITAKLIRVMLLNQEKNTFQGNGQPVVAGQITAISGNTITLTNNSNNTYTIDATNAKFLENGVESTISSIEVKDKVVVQGTISGTNVTATSIIVDNGISNAKTEKTGFFRSVGNFFTRLFGF